MVSRKVLLVQQTLLLLSFCVFEGISGINIGGTKQSGAAKGKLLCGGKPYKGAKVKLWDKDTLDPDDLMAESETNAEGEFEVNGSETEVSNIDLRLSIYHNCEDEAKECLRRIDIDIGDEFISRESDKAGKEYDDGENSIQIPSPTSRRRPEQSNAPGPPLPRGLVVFDLSSVFTDTDSEQYPSLNMRRYTFIRQFYPVLRFLADCYFALVGVVFGLINAFKPVQHVSWHNASELLFIPAHKAAEMIREGNLTSTDLVSAYISRLKEVNPLLNAFAHQNFDGALMEAKNVDSELAKMGADKRKTLADTKPLCGVPFTSKDNLKTKGFVTGAGNQYLIRGGSPATDDAEVVKRMKEAGAILVAITVLPNLALSWSGDDSGYGIANNPHDTRRITGGSSSGEGALIGAGASLFGIGNDIGGSIRIPSNMNGIFGLKPTNFPELPLTVFDEFVNPTLKNFRATQALKNLHATQALKNLHATQALKNLHATQALKNLQATQALTILFTFADCAIDPDDLMAESETNAEGGFELNGSETEVSNIDLRLSIYHNCEDEAKDIGGSIRIPSNMNGIFGLKPTNFPEHVVPLDGIVPASLTYKPAENMLTNGPLCRYATDLPIALSVLAGKNASSYEQDVNFAKDFNMFYMEEVDVLLSQGLLHEQRNAVRQVKRYFEEKYNLTVQKVEFPLLSRVFELFYLDPWSPGVPTFAELKTMFKQIYTGVANETFLQCEFEALKYFLVPKDDAERDFVAKKKAKLRTQVANLLGKNGVLLTPLWPTFAPFHHMEPFTAFNLKYTIMVNLLGFPALAAPVGKSATTNMPLGVQLIASPLNEALLVAAAKELELAKCRQTFLSRPSHNWQTAQQSSQSVLFWELPSNLFVYQNIFWYPPNIVLATGFWSILFGTIVGHVMMVERMLATLFVAKYEKNKGLSFTIIWLLIAIILCTALSYHQIYVLNSLFFASIFMFSIVAFVMMTSFIEIFGIILLMKFNKKLFVTQNAEMVNNVHQLTVRYQLTENIRTGRQLAPNFISHFIGVLVTFVFITNNCFQLFTKPEYLAFIIQIVVFIHSINHFMLPIAIIRFHPILNQKARFISATTAAVVAAVVVAAVVADRAAYGSMNKNHRSAAGSNTGWLAGCLLRRFSSPFASFVPCGGRTKSHCLKRAHFQLAL
uniref:PAZ domain-containing protein n=1 Tax=Globodera pallida TaxID=36090 RepID=A0A183BNV3_GLOPA